MRSLTASAAAATLVALAGCGGSGSSSSTAHSTSAPDGTKQVTYKGHTLYFFANDKDDGDSYGPGLKSFGSSWYVLAPSGAKVDNS